METDYRGVLGEGTVTPDDYSEMFKEMRSEPEHILAMWEWRWQALQSWLLEARGRDYVTRTPAVVLQKMRDLMGDES